MLLHMPSSPADWGGNRQENSRLTVSLGPLRAYGPAAAALGSLRERRTRFLCVLWAYVLGAYVTTFPSQLPEVIICTEANT